MSDRTTGSDDEALSALLDGELDAAQAASLRKRIEREPALAARFAALEAANRRVRRAYDGVAAEPVPERVRALLGEAHGARNVAALPERRARLKFAPLPTALAASVALAVGVALGLLVASHRPSFEAGATLAAVGELAPADPLFAALETAPSGAERDLGGGVSAEPRLTFRTREGGYCRRVDLARDDEGALVLACRRGGGWRIEAASFARIDAPAGAGFRPATEAASAVEAAIDAAIEGDPLSADAERALLEGGWAGAR